MNRIKFLPVLFSLLITLVALTAQCQTKKPKPEKYPTDSLPAPYATKSVTNFCDVVGWKEGERPMAVHGFMVTKYADGFNNPRWLYNMPNGDVVVCESNSNHTAVEKVGGSIIGASKSNNLKNSANIITILRDKDKDGIPEVRDTFLTGLDQPFGMLLMNKWFYVANVTSVWRYPYEEGQLKITGKGEMIAELPGKKHPRHWTRNLIASPDNSKIYIAVGSGTNVAEDGIEAELLRADILEMNPDGSGLKVFASGLRNPVGMDWQPGTNVLWTAVNERDELGDDLVPDYATSVKKDGFYGWPYSYFGQNIDPRVKDPKPELVKKTIIPDIKLKAHTATLGLAFYTKKAFPEKYHNGLFLAQHGSWNRSVLTGYKVVFVPFKDGKPSGEPEDFLDFRVDNDPKSNKVHGRPVCVIVLPDGNLLVTDDTSNTIWHVAAAKK